VDAFGRGSLCGDGYAFTGVFVVICLALQFLWMASRGHGTVGYGCLPQNLFKSMHKLQAARKRKCPWYDGLFLVLVSSMLVWPGVSEALRMKY
jgi:hypothetical protein